MKIKISLMLALLCLLTTLSYAEKPQKSTKKKVNAIAFWGFLDDPAITKDIEKKCNVEFSHDVYYTNSEFLNTFNKRENNYDVMIFSNLIYGSIKNQIPHIKSDLSKKSAQYYPYFKNYYASQHYPQNASFFTHAMVGFMYNPKVISIKKNQNIFEIFKNAGNNDVILVDDSGEIGSLLNVAFKTQYKNTKGTVPLTYKNLKKMTQNSHVYITSDFNKIYDSSKFAFSYIWSGDALLYIQKSKKPYKFIIPPNATSICTDLLVQMKQTPEAKCVADELQAQTLQKQFIKDSYYFTPVFTNMLHESSYDALYKEVKTNLPKYHMIEPLKDFSGTYDNQWQDIKLKLKEEND